MVDPILSRSGVCEVEYVRGVRCDRAAPPDLVLEVPHGATRAAHFTDLRREFVGDVAEDLRDFFFVNTDVGAPELAHAIAAAVVTADPRRSAVVVRCLLPRTFVDCNRRIDRASVPAASAPGQMTPGMPPWIRDDRDRAMLLDRYFAYRDVATAAFDAVCGNGGLGLCVHTYAPRSVDVAVDENIVASMHAAYAPERAATWPLRSSVDLITHDPEGREMASPRLVVAALAELAATGFDVAQNSAYSLHPITLAWEFATRYPGATLCFEVRRDLLVPEFTPFREMIPDAARVRRAAAPFAAAVLASLH